MNGLLSKEDLVNPYASVKNNKTPLCSSYLSTFFHSWLPRNSRLFWISQDSRKNEGKKCSQLCKKRILYCIYKAERWFKVRIWKTSLAYTTLKRQIAGDFFKVGETAANSSESCEDASCLETLFILARVSWQMFSLALLTSSPGTLVKQTYLATFATVTWSTLASIILFVT